ncbi:unnamed protein product [Enterobius vermicularis]|uniref:SpoU_methylase domain-containing protein n=1 Tax=Enterobius vermicularis TaxID=51028 RepID=A0A158QA42_ENTVE|nr:unnamed protein product [Enterobius vermicularis]
MYETRRLLFRVVEQCSSKDLTTAVLILYYCAQKNWSFVNILKLCRSLVNYTKSRQVRKVIIGTLKTILANRNESFWSVYFVVLDAMEEPQFHLVEPVLPRINILLDEFLKLDQVGDKTFYWEWIEVLLAKGLLHPNGWIRNWTIMRIISIDPNDFLFSQSVSVNPAKFFVTPSTLFYQFWCSRLLLADSLRFSFLMIIYQILLQENREVVYHWCLKKITDTAQQYSVKLLEEWILIKLLCTQPKLIEDFTNQERTDTISFCFQSFLPWCTAQNFSIRCSAIAALRCLWVSSSALLRENSEHIRRVITFDAEPAGNARRIVETLCNDFYFSVFHPEENYNLQVICDIFPRKTGLPDEETIPPTIFPDVFFINEVPFVLYEASGTLEAAPSLVFSVKFSFNCACFAKRSDKQSLLNFTAQKELGDLSGDDVQRKLCAARGKWRRPEGKSLVVVASLVSKATNLGGLCRTCEVFGVEKLVIADLNVLNDQNFKALSTSSEKWVDFVKPSELIDYLKTQRDQGYTIIAAEQSTGSVYFNNFKYPKKWTESCFRDEREGIPVHLIRFVDSTVEIPQTGQTRSLNVHVTGALFIEKYAEAHYF